MSDSRLLTFNCHEAWVHQLGALGRPLDIIDGLPGRYIDHWDSRMRPVPAGARLITLQQARSGEASYSCIIGHSLTDLFAVKELSAPRILMLHVTLDHRLQQAQLEQAPAQLRASIERYLDMVGGVAVAVTAMKADSWGLRECEVIESAADPNDYLPWSGHEAAGLRVANQINSRREYLHWDFHEASFAGVPVRIVGHNPDMDGVEPARDWDELKQLLSAHRFFIHTAGPQLEDGFNMALMEALAAGLPVIGNRHHSSPITHDVNGLLSDDPLELASHAKRLLQDNQLAARLSAAARQLASERFSPTRFAEGMTGAMNKAHHKWQQRPGSQGSPGS